MCATHACTCVFSLIHFKLPCATMGLEKCSCAAFVCLFLKFFLKSQAELLSIADGASTARVDQGHNVRFLKVVLFQV